MGLRKVNRIRRRAIGILSACFILLVLGFLEAAWIDYYFLPTIIATPGRVYLIYRRNPQIGGFASAYLHASHDGVSWSDAVCLPFDPGPAQVIGGNLYAMRGKHYSLFDLDSIFSGEEVQWESWGSSRRFELDWKVALALLDNGGLRLLGIENTDSGKIVIREAVLENSAVRELPHSVEIDRFELIAACAREGTLYLLHRGLSEKKVHLLKRGPEGEWEKAGEIPGPLALFDCAHAAGALHVVGTPAELGETGDWRLVHYMVGADGSVTGPLEFEHGIKTFFGSLRHVSEVSLAGRGDIVCFAGRFGNVVATSVWSGAWSEFTTVNRVPLSTRAVMWGWLFSVLSLCGALVFTGFQLYLAKRRRGFEPDTPQVPETVEVETAEVEPAGIVRRLAAFTVDFAVVYMVIYLVARPAQMIPGGRSALEIVSLHHPLVLRMIVLAYFALPEAVFGQTVGKGLLGIVVKSETGRGIGIWNALLRNLFKLIELLLIVEVVVLLNTQKSRRLGDFVAGTVVARQRSRAGKGKQGR